MIDLKYPRPDRSDFQPNFKKTAENDVLDIGWAEGILSDGRPYRFECWCQDQLTCVTIFLPRADLEGLDDDACQSLLEKEGLLQFPFEERYLTVLDFEDASGHALYSVNIVIGDEDGTFATGGPTLSPYPAPIARGSQ